MLIQKLRIKQMVKILKVSIIYYKTMIKILKNFTIYPSIGNFLYLRKISNQNINKKIKLLQLKSNIS